MSRRPSPWPGTVTVFLAGCLLLGALGSLQADEKSDRRSRMAVVLFDAAFDAPPPQGGPSADVLSTLLNEGLSEALRAGGYDPMPFNPDSPTVLRALDRERTLQAEDTVHPEREASARRIAGAYGARYVLFPRLAESTLDVASGQGRVLLRIRVVPNLGAVQNIQGSGTGQVKPEKRSRDLGTRILTQAIHAASRDAVRALTALGSGTSTPDVAPDEAETYYTQAMASLRENRLDLVVPLLERATRLNPQKVEYALALGDAYQRAGDQANALVEYRRAVSMQPTSVDLRVRLARVYLQRSMLREASAELRRAARLDPNNADLRSTLVEVYLANGMLEEAAAEYQRLAQASPSDASIRLKLGDLQARRGLFDEARAEYEAAAKLDGSNPVPHEKLAALYRQRGMHREALREMLAAQRTPAGADDVQRYRAIAAALDDEARFLLAETSRVAQQRRNEQLTREEAYLALKGLSARADALAAEMADLTPPQAVADAHRRRVFAYSLLTQSLFGYLSYYESDRLAEGSNAALLHSQAVQELQRAHEATGAP